VLGAAYRAEERFLWGLCYRMSGSAADADDLVQETFARALASPPRRTDEPLRPWLARVAMNLSRDHLRLRKRRGYVGPWLPSLVETGDEAALPSFEPTSTEGRYDLLESVSLAFLLALEALTPRQRAVLLLADVFDYATRESAAALGMSEANVKTTHHRARKAMAAYDQARSVPTAAAQDRTRSAVKRFLAALASDDMAGIQAQLAEGVVSMSDAAGEYHAARLPVIGRAKVAQFYAKQTRVGAMTPRIRLRNLNGAPAVLLEYPAAPGTWAQRFVMAFDVDATGAIARIYVVMAGAKLARVRFE
jgi:RNA polymerase sigma-70 factor (ECF subfamily)